MSEMVKRVEKAIRNTVFQTGGKHGLTWQIVQQFSGHDSCDVVMFVGRKFAENESLKNPPADMLYEMRFCKARAAVEAMREPLLAIIAKEEQDFLSPEYATGQPLSSLSERFACREVAKAIAAALSPSREDERKAPGSPDLSL